MGIGDHKQHDSQDLMTEHTIRLEKGKNKVATQLDKIADAFDQMRKPLRNQSTYYVTPDMWRSATAGIRKLLADFEAEIERVERQHDRGKPTWNWSKGEFE